jgi:hypothetical protein
MKSGQAGAEAIATKGWLASHKWLLARRATQLGILALFLLGPLSGIWIVKAISSMTTRSTSCRSRTRTCSCSRG